MGVGTFDVAIIGNSFAANICARHLNLYHPNLKVAVVGKARDNKYGVGESLTELGSHCLMHRLKLGSYMYRNQLPKNGIRLFFDGEHKDTPIEELSEESPGTLVLHPTFHIDRASFEKDVRKINLENNISFVDENVGSVEFDNTNTLVLENNETIQATWIIDASGKQRVISKQLDLIKKDNTGHSAAWAHFNSQNMLDKLSLDWKRSVYFVTREFSTVHFAYPGYWFWMIPGKDDTISLGVVYDKKVTDLPVHTQEDFVAFVQKHTALSSLFDQSTIKNYKTAEHFAYEASTYVDAEKKFMLLGDSGSFIDPLYSSGFDLAAQQLDVYGDILQGYYDDQDVTELSRQTNAFIDSRNMFYRTIIHNNLPAMGSAEVFNMKYFCEFYTFVLFTFWPYASQALLENHQRVDASIAEKLRFMHRGFVPLAQQLQQEGLYYRQNKNLSSGLLAAMSVMEHFFAKISPKQNKYRQQELQSLYTYLLKRQLNIHLHRNDLHTSKLMEQTLQQMPWHKNEQGDYRGLVDVVPQFTDLRSWHTDQMNNDRGSPVLDLQLENSRLFMRHQVDMGDDNKDAITRLFTLDIATLEHMMNDTSSYLYPFVIEALAMQYTIEKQDTKAGLQLLQKVAPQMADFVYGGVGMAVGSNPKIQYPQSDHNFLENGCGFGAALQANIKRKVTVFPPRALRKNYARGIGRFVTFIEDQQNTPQKYADYFSQSTLYPEDADDFYQGAGFSYLFSCDPLQANNILKKIDSLKNLYPKAFIDGILQAKEVKCSIQPQLYFALV